MSKINSNVTEKADEAMPVTLRINGIERELQLEPRVSLLDALREYVGLAGTKKGCDQGACGACTVLVENERINSCFALAVQYQGREITTIEGVSNDEQLHVLQAAFIEGGWFPVRVLYARSNLFRHRYAGGVQAGNAERGDGEHFLAGFDVLRRRDKGAHERQPVSLRRVCWHRRGNPRSIWYGGGAMKNFAYTRAENAGAAIPDELITSVELPALSFAGNSMYRKVRDRASYAFALVSVAAALEV
jgi:ferredoxin